MESVKFIWTVSKRTATFFRETVPLSSVKCLPVRREKIYQIFKRKGGGFKGVLNNVKKMHNLWSGTSPMVSLTVENAVSLLTQCCIAIYVP